MRTLHPAVRIYALAVARRDTGRLHIVSPTCVLILNGKPESFARVIAGATRKPRRPRKRV